jgi:hypothetical protein
MGSVLGKAAKPQAIIIYLGPIGADVASQTAGDDLISTSGKPGPVDFPEEIDVVRQIPRPGARNSEAEIGVRSVTAICKIDSTVEPRLPTMAQSSPGFSKKGV